MKDFVVGVIDEGGMLLGMGFWGLFDSWSIDQSNKLIQVEKTITNDDQKNRLARSCHLMMLAAHCTGASTPMFRSRSQISIVEKSNFDLHHGQNNLWQFLPR